jgi:hypothetical protein
MANPQGKRAIAKQNGDKTYFTGVPCKRGHVCNRYTKSAGCVECMYMATIEYIAKNRETVRRNERECYAKRIEHFREKNRRYGKENLEKKRASVKSWSEKNRDKVRATAMRRYTKKLHATPPWLTESDNEWINAIYKIATKMQEQSGIKMAVDHIVPLQSKIVCGLHVPWNLRVISFSENSGKHTKITDDVYLPKQTGVMVGRSGLPWNWSKSNEC